jgi:hypothetical protein
LTSHINDLLLARVATKFAVAGSPRSRTQLLAATVRSVKPF